MSDDNLAVHVGFDTSLDGAFNSNYSKLSYYLLQLESIDLDILFGQLLNYLKCLTSDSSEQFLPELQHQLSSEFSWLAKASIVNQLPEQLEKLEQYISQISSASAQRVALEDAKRRIKYISKIAGEKLLEDISQIYNGVHILFDEKLPLDEVREEVSGYLKERDIRDFSGTTVQQFQLRLTRMNSSSIVSSLRQLTKQIKPLPIQADLFLKRYIASATNISNGADSPEREKLELQYQANKFIADQLLEKIKTYLSKARELLPEKIVNRLTKKISTLSVARVVQNYVDARKAIEAKVVVNTPANPQSPYQTGHDMPSASDFSMSKGFNEQQEKLKQEQIRQDEQSRIKQAQEQEKLRREQLERQRVLEAQEREFKQAQSLQRAQEETKVLEESIVHAEDLVKSVQLFLETYKVQYDCVAKLKSCYQRFNSHFFIQKLIQKNLYKQKEINNCLSQMDIPIHWSSLGLSEQQASNMQSMQKEARDEIVLCLESLNKHYSQLESKSQLEKTNKTIASWQANMSQLILSASTEQLIKYSNQFSQISRISNKYLRAILTVHYHKINHKLSDVIIKNMASWSDRSVDISTVANMLSYLSIKLSDENVLKIMPSNFDKNSHAKYKNYRKTAWYCLYDDLFSWLLDQYEAVLYWFSSLKNSRSNRAKK